MNQFAQNLSALQDGHKLTDHQLIDLLIQLRTIENTLIGMGMYSTQLGWLLQ